MAPYITYTDRLILAIELPEIADKVLEFYIKNASTFERYEPTRPEDFYTLEYHQQAMEGELSLYDMGSFVRYYIYTKDDPDLIVSAQMGCQIGNAGDRSAVTRGRQIAAQNSCKKRSYIIQVQGKSQRGRCAWQDEIDQNGSAKECHLK